MKRSIRRWYWRARGRAAYIRHIRRVELAWSGKSISDAEAAELADEMMDDRVTRR